MRFIGLGSMLVLLSLVGFGQENENIERAEGVISKGDTTLIVTETPRNRPNKIALYSAILPGLGQAMNKKAWKIPIIYGGVTFLIYSSSNFNTKYDFFRDAFFLEVDGDPDTINETGLNESQLRRRVEFFRRNRDFFYILTGVLYLLNVVDAHVDAHLRDFDVNDDIALAIKPAMVSNPWNIPNVGLTLQLKLKP